MDGWPLTYVIDFAAAANHCIFIYVSSAMGTRADSHHSMPRTREYARVPSSGAILCSHVIHVPTAQQRSLILPRYAMRRARRILIFFFSINTIIHSFLLPLNWCDGSPRFDREHQSTPLINHSSSMQTQNQLTDTGGECVSEARRVCRH